MQQYFVDDDFSFKNFDLSKDDSFHIIKVMRKMAGKGIIRGKHRVQEQEKYMIIMILNCQPWIAEVIR